MESKTLQCPNCDTDIYIEDVEEAELEVCSNCGHRYRVEYDSFDEHYRLVTEEPEEIPTDIDTDKI